MQPLTIINMKGGGGCRRRMTFVRVRWFCYMQYIVSFRESYLFWITREQPCWILINHCIIIICIPMNGFWFIQLDNLKDHKQQKSCYTKRTWRIFWQWQWTWFDRWWRHWLYYSHSWITIGFSGWCYRFGIYEWQRTSRYHVVPGY